MKLLTFGGRLVVFTAIWFTLMGIWLGISFMMSNRFLTDLPSRPLFNLFWRTSDGMLVFTGQADFANSIIGSVFTCFIAFLLTAGILRCLSRGNRVT